MERESKDREEILKETQAIDTQEVEVEDEPKQNLDVNSVYGSLEDSLECGEGGFTVTAIGVDGAGGGILAGKERVFKWEDEDFSFECYILRESGMDKKWSRKPVVVVKEYVNVSADGSYICCICQQTFSQGSLIRSYYCA